MQPQSQPQQNVKSATTAGLLGIFLGSFGAHNWYLGEKNKGIAHVCMMSGGIIVDIISSLVLPNVMNIFTLASMSGLLLALTGIASLAMSASAIWGLVEGIQILAQGDAGLARKGYMVAQPAMNQNYGYQQPNGYGAYGYNQQNYGPQSYGPQNYGQPMGNQPMNNQPMNGQPMNNNQPMNEQPADWQMNNNFEQPSQNPQNGDNNAA